MGKVTSGPKFRTDTSVSFSLNPVNPRCPFAYTVVSLKAKTKRTARVLAAAFFVEQEKYQLLSVCLRVQ